jgi:hypothetical protein
MRKAPGIAATGGKSLCPHHHAIRVAIDSVASRMAFRSPVAQSVEHAAVNRDVVRSIRTWGATYFRSVSQRPDGLLWEQAAAGSNPATPTRSWKMNRTGAPALP